MFKILNGLKLLEKMIMIYPFQSSSYKITPHRHYTRRSINGHKILSIIK